MENVTVSAVFVGQPKLLTDAQGPWTSSIFRESTPGPVVITQLGLAGDRVAQTYHGGPDAALCVHLADHYLFWQRHHGLDLQPGSFGENVLLGPGATEDGVCIGDRYRLGTALVEVSAPRVPCANLARRIGYADWVQRTIVANRTGFYLRVLAEGTVQAGASWQLVERPVATVSISAINRCMYLQFDPALAERMTSLPQLASWWQEQARQKLAATNTHWTSNLV